MKRLALTLLGWLLVALLAGCATVAPPPGPTAAAPREAAEAAWARVLDRFVDARGEVDFHALAADRVDLDTYLRHIALTPLTPLSALERDRPDDQLAHLINAYNALSMFNVIDSGFPAQHAGFAKLRFFVLRRFEIGGRAMSLYSFENDVIRPLARELREPRIHFALNCSARSCPQLPRVPFTGAALRAELERETRAFFARRDAYCVDDAGQTVWLSALLDFYPEDFVPAAAPTLAAYAAQWAAQPAPAAYRTAFLPYDWTIAARGTSPPVPAAGAACGT